MKKIFLLLAALLVSVSTLADNETTDPVVREKKSNWEIQGSTGITFLTGKSNLSPLGINYRNHYSHGWSNTLQVYHKTGIGLMYSALNTSGNYQIDDGDSYADDIFIYYIAPQMKADFKISPRVNFYVNLGLGYLHYKNQAYVNDEKTTFTSQSFGVNGGLQLEYKVSDIFSFILESNTIGGRGFKKLKAKSEGGIVEISPSKHNRIRLSSTSLNLGFILKFPTGKSK